MQQSINLLFKIHILVGVAPVVWFVVANTVIEELASRKYSKKILMKCALSISLNHVAKRMTSYKKSNMFDRSISFQ